MRAGHGLMTTPIHIKQQVRLGMSIFKHSAALWVREIDIYTEHPYNLFFKMLF